MIISTNAVLSVRESFSPLKTVVLAGTAIGATLFIGLFHNSLIAAEPKNNPPGDIARVSKSDLSKAVSQHSLTSQLTRIDRVPLYFEQNIGQTRSDVVFTSNTPNYKLELRRQDAIMTLLSGTQEESGRNLNNVISKLRIKPVRTNPDAEIVGLKLLPSTSSYFTSKTPKNWVQGAPHYSGVKYKSIYPGINLEYYGNRQELEYDFIIKPGADPTQIKMTYEGVDQVHIDETGNAILEFDNTALIQKRPYVFQTIDGIEKEIEAEYAVYDSGADGTPPLLGFRLLAAYDKSKELIIDPVLSYSALLGGDLYDSGSNIAIDNIGNSYVVSRTFSVDNSDANATSVNCQNHCQSNVMVSKFSSNGSKLLWSVILSGSGDEDGSGIAVDDDNNVYVAGWTNSEDFPMLKAHDYYFDGLSEGFITKIDAHGTKLLYSTYAGNSQSEIITDINLAVNGDVLISGRTSAAKFSESDHLNNDPRINTDGFISRYSNDGQTRLFTKYLGGSQFDSVEALTSDKHGNIYVTGTTDSANFPVKNALFDQLKGVSDAFISQYSADGKDLLFSSFLGGNGAEYGKDISLDTAGNPVIAGVTTSDNLPVKNTFDETRNGRDGDWDSFVTKLSSDGSKLLHSGYLGGSLGDYATSVKVDKQNNTYVAGYTLSDDFPVQNPIFKKLNGKSDLFIAKMTASGRVLSYSTLFGGSHEESYADIEIDNTNSLYITGITYSEDFPSHTTPSMQQTPIEMSGETFISKISNLMAYEIPSNSWQIISLPYIPPGNASVEDIFGDDIVQAYNTHWFLYRHDPVTGTYKLLQPNENLQQGEAYWMLQTTGKAVTIDMPEGSYTLAKNEFEHCPGGNECFVTPLITTAGKNQFHFVGNPFAEEVPWQHVLLMTDTGECDARKGGCNLFKAYNAGLIAKTGVTHVNGENFRIGGGDKLQPWQGFWIESFAKLHGQNASLVFTN